MKQINWFFFLLTTLFANNVIAQSLTTKEKNGLRYEAGTFVKELELLLNNLSSDESNKLERDIMIDNSFRPSGNQIFLNQQVIIEDDVNPNRYDFNEVTDFPIEIYLRNFELFYTKQEKNTIEFTDIYVSEVKEGNYIYLEVYFKSQFKGKHLTYKEAYRKTSRVATIIAEKNKKSWILKIASIVFYNPRTHDSLFQLNRDPLNLKDFTIKQQLQQPNSKPDKTISTAPKTPKRNSFSDNRTLLHTGMLLGYQSRINRMGIGLSAQIVPKQSLLSYFINWKYLFTEDFNRNGGNFTVNRYDLSFGMSYTTSNNQGFFNPFFSGGFNYLRSTLKNDTLLLNQSLNSSAFGLELGAGVAYKKGKNSRVNYTFLMNYITGKASRLAVNLGINYSFMLK
ncbi:MAG: hypothetical protein AAGI07_14850 [Bacteroidota bacterium]